MVNGGAGIVNKSVVEGSRGMGGSGAAMSHFQLVDKGVPVSVQVATQLIAAIEQG